MITSGVFDENEITYFRLNVREYKLDSFKGQFIRNIMAYGSYSEEINFKICKFICDRLGGRIAVDQNVFGSLFSFSIPVTRIVEHDIYVTTSPRL